MAKKSVCSSCGMSAEGEQKFCSVCGSAMNVTDVPEKTPAADFIPPVMQEAMNGSPDSFADAIPPAPSAGEENTPSFDDIMNGGANTAQNNTASSFGGTSYGGAGSIPNINAYNTYNTTPSAPKKSNKDGLAIGGLITGIASVVLCCFNCIDIPVAIVGLIISIIGLKSETKKGCAIGGIITSIAGLLLSIFILVIAFISGAFEDYTQVYNEVYEEFYDDMYSDDDMYDYEYYYD